MNSSQQMLSVSDHNRSFISMSYVYPVVSRRAGGVSVGINLNPNNACNWHCAYCQVPDLVRGAAPEIGRETVGLAEGIMICLANMTLTLDRRAAEIMGIMASPAPRMALFSTNITASMA